MDNDSVQTQSPDPRRPWEQQPQEPKAAYVRFLVFRNLGPSRTVADAAKVAKPEGQPQGTKGNKGKPAASKQYYEDSAEWNWYERAQLWDIHRLTESGDRVQSAMTDLMCDLACMGMRALRKCGEPKNWSEVLTLFKALTEHVPQALTARPESATVDGSACESATKLRAV